MFSFFPNHTPTIGQINKALKVGDFIEGLTMSPAEFAYRNYGDVPAYVSAHQQAIAHGSAFLERFGPSDQQLYNAERAKAIADGTASKGILPTLGIPTGTVSGATASSGSAAKPIIYSDWSPSARFFGMDQSTAYAEHMANTAHQREVADLRAAGLNPVLGVGSGAAGVSGSVAHYGTSTGKKVSDSKWIDAIGATIGLITSLTTKRAATGRQADKAVVQLLEALFT